MALAAFAFGLVIGSFLNVCIYQIPAGRSIVRPRSSCPACGHLVRGWDNVPVLSWILLRGRCRDCGARISARYPLVELLSGGFAVLTAERFGVGWEGLLMFALVAAFLVITFIDIDPRIIPDVISLPGIAVGVAASVLPWLIAGMQPADTDLPVRTPLESLVGMLVGGGSLFLVAWGYERITGREGMGGGDIKLLAMIGAFMGWKGVFFTIFVASLTGTVAGLALMLRQRGGMKLAVPFGPFLAIGAIAYLFMGPETFTWYLQALR